MPNLGNLYLPKPAPQKCKSLLLIFLLENTLISLKIALPCIRLYATSIKSPF